MADTLSIVGFGYNRDKYDFYPTPPSATEALFSKEKFDGMVWECASGNGSMSKVIEKYNQCFSSDIRTDNGVYGAKEIDFLKTLFPFPNIITNPPYKLAERFVYHALELPTIKVAMFLKLVFLESSSRYKLFKTTPLKIVYVFSKRQTLSPRGEVTTGGLIAYAWFVWDKSYSGKPMLDWIL